jgi:putative Mn2+ efflux pump MntP
MIEVILLAIGLSMDVFAVSIGLGIAASGSGQVIINQKKLQGAVIVALSFGAFHAFFPLVGYLGGITLFSWFEDISKWIGFSILVFLGLKSIYDSTQESDNELTHSLTYTALLILAVATSIDALATGFTLALLTVPPLVSCLIIGVTTFTFSLFGLYLGSSSSERLAPISSMLGGIILIVIGFKILLF